MDMKNQYAKYAKYAKTYAHTHQVYTHTLFLYDTFNK
jgi:hypothetical protein